MALQRLQGDRGRALTDERSDDPRLSIRSSSKERTPSIFNQRSSRLMGLSLLVSGLLLAFLRVRDSDVNRFGTEVDHHNLRSTASDSQCLVYLAESSIPNGGLGVFTARNVPLGGQIGDLGACILVKIPRSGANQLYSHTHGSNSWTWGTENGVRQFCPGISTIVNTQSQKSNMAITSIARPTNAGLTRFKSPGAGAVTHHYGQYHVALKDIPAGSEITYDYGDWKLPGEESKVEKRTMPHRPLTFLREHGMCMDNIAVKASTLPHAGRGAFASRAMKSGDLVAPAPLIVIKDKSSFHENELLLNYMFEIEGTKMAFVPYGEGVTFINHSKKPNVGLRWSSSKFHQAGLLELTQSSFEKKVWPGALIVEVVALRLIRPGEELFLNYGATWEQAWTEHVAHWKPSDIENYVYPSGIDETLDLRTVTEQETKPYAPNLATVCRNPFWERGPFEYQWEEPASHPEDVSWNCWCHILEKEVDRKEEELGYTVSLQCHDYKEYDPSVPRSKQQILANVPRHAIHWENKPFQSDQFMNSVFRHPMTFPSELVPTQWKRKV